MITAVVMTTTGQGAKWLKAGEPPGPRVVPDEARVMDVSAYRQGVTRLMGERGTGG